MPNAPYRHQHRVTYAECTVGNHIYHSRYLDLLEAARGEYLRHLGPTVHQLQLADRIFPVIECRLRYQAPARYDDWLEIEVWPTAVEKIRLNFAHRVTRPATGTLILLPQVEGGSRSVTPTSSILMVPSNSWYPTTTTILSIPGKSLMVLQGSTL